MRDYHEKTPELAALRAELAKEYTMQPQRRIQLYVRMLREAQDELENQ